METPSPTTALPAGDRARPVVVGGRDEQQAPRIQDATTVTHGVGLVLIPVPRLPNTGHLRSRRWLATCGNSRSGSGFRTERALAKGASLGNCEEFSLDRVSGHCGSWCGTHVLPEKDLIQIIRTDTAHSDESPVLELRA